MTGVGLPDSLAPRRAYVGNGPAGAWHRSRTPNRPNTVGFSSGTNQGQAPGAALFPYLTTGEHGAFARRRLTAFRSPSEWVIAFEILGYPEEAGRFLDMVYNYGKRADWPCQCEHIEFMPPSGWTAPWMSGWEPDLFDLGLQIHGYGCPGPSHPGVAAYAPRCFGLPTNPEEVMVQ